MATGLAAYLQPRRKPEPEPQQDTSPAQDMSWMPPSNLDLGRPRPGASQYPMGQYAPGIQVLGAGQTPYAAGDSFNPQAQAAMISQGTPQGIQTTADNALLRAKQQNVGDNYRVAAIRANAPDDFYRRAQDFGKGDPTMTQLFMQAIAARLNPQTPMPTPGIQQQPQPQTSQPAYGMLAYR